MTSEVWVARYPDLAGKVALVAGAGDGVVAVTAVLAANGSPVGVVCGDRAVVDAALAAAGDTAGMGVVGMPDDPATWERVVPHTEQRLGPLDVVIAIGPFAARQAVIDATLPDMTARARGVIVEVGDTAPSLATTGGVRRRFVQVSADTSPSDLGAAVALCSSDVLAAPLATIQLIP